MLFVDPATAGLEEILDRRRRAGIDRFDEVWEGVLHMVPAPRGEHADIAYQLAVVLDGPMRAAGLWPALDFNLGDSEHDYRVPDVGFHRDRPHGVWFATAAIVIEIASPGDESWEKLPFYAGRLVDEVLVIDPLKRAVHWLALTDGEYAPVARSALIDLGADDLAARIDWPPTA